MKMARHGLTWALAAVLAFGSEVVTPQESFAAGQGAQTDNNIQADLQNQLKKFNDVEIKVNNASVITLKPAIRYQFKTGQRDWPKT
jgi:hypothetical protein